VHEGGWTLTLDPDRTITLIRPDGVIHYHGPSITRRPAPTEAAEAARAGPARAGPPP
jgi:hypothetical protein